MKPRRLRAKGLTVEFLAFGEMVERYLENLEEKLRSDHLDLESAALLEELLLIGTFVDWAMVAHRPGLEEIAWKRMMELGRTFQDWKSIYPLIKYVLKGAVLSWADVLASSDEEHLWVQTLMDLWHKQYR